MRVLARFQGLLGAAVARNFLFAVAAIAGVGSLPSRADAGNYTVYIYNMRTDYGWIRSGFTHDVYTSERACRNSIVSRVNENRRYRTDFEAFAVVYQNARPPAGLIRGYVAAYIMYIPGVGYMASAEGPSKRGDTALCQAAPPDRAAEPVRVRKAIDPYHRHEAAPRRREEAIA